MDARADQESPEARPSAQRRATTTRRGRTFRWSDARAELAGAGRRRSTSRDEAIDRHARGPLADKVALRWRGKRGERRDITYAELARRDARGSPTRCAGSGSRPGDVVFALCPRIPELYVAALGTLAAQARVLAAVLRVRARSDRHARRSAASGRVLVTTASLYAAQGRADPRAPDVARATSS